MDIADCKRKGFITVAVPNASKARSLLEMAAIKEEEVRLRTLNERNINVYLPVAYDALREVLEAFCLLHNYAVSNHVCLGELAKTLHPSFDLVSFDRFRYARNGINYYGVKVDLEQGRMLIDKILVMKREMETIVATLL